MNMTTTTTLDQVVQSQLESLDDTDCYATAWQAALQKARVHWGGRGQGGRGLARRTFQPHDVNVEAVDLEYVGQATLLKQATLKLLSGQVYALIGRNGSGKSTLLRRIHAGRIPGFPPHVSTLYLPQEVLLSCNDEENPQQWLLQQQQEFSNQSVHKMQEHVEEQMEQLDVGDDERMQELLMQASCFEDEITMNATDQRRQIQEALQFVGINNDQNKRMSRLSCGQRKKVQLALPLVCPCDLLLLDEPTNALDVQGLLMLCQLIFELSSRQTTILLVSHDVDLIDNVADQVIDLHDHDLWYWPGNYSHYRQTKQQVDIHQARQASALEKKRHAMMKTLVNLKKQPTPKRGGAKKKAKQISSHRKKIERQGLEKDDKGHKRTNQKAGTGVKPGSLNAMDASTRKGLTTSQLLEMSKKSEPEKAIQFSFRNVSSQWNEPVIMANDVGHGFDISPHSPVEHDTLEITKKDGYLFDCVDLCIEEGETYCLVGESASGKSTLLRILAKLIKPLEGTVKHALNVDVALVDQHQIDSLLTTQQQDEHAISYLTRLFPYKTEQEIRGELTAFGLNPKQACTNIRFLSGGERSRLCLAAAMLSNPQVLLLDDPTANLDVESVQALIYGLEHWNGTVVMVSHDMHFVRSLDAKCFALVAEEGKLRRIPGGIDAYLRSFT